MHQLKLMHGSVMAHPEARKILELGETEVTFHCQREGYNTKSRHDILIESAKVSCDLKTLDPGSKEFSEAWGAAVEKRRYDVQAAHYNEDFKHELGCNLKAFYFIVVSKSLSMGRYECRVMKLNPEQKEQGMIDRNKDVKRYLDCMNSGKFPGIETTVTPAYAKRG
jgi:exodeoxyribonuclease VIII